MEPQALTFDWTLAAALATSAAIALFLPVVLVLLLWRRTGASPRWALYGAGVFFVSQVVLRLPWQVPLGIWLAPKLKESEGLMFAWIAFSAITAGLFEETGRYLGYRWFLKRERTWRVGAMFGAGHGGIESILLVGLNLAGSVVFYWLLTHGSTAGLPDESLAVVRDQLSKLTAPLALLGGVERMWALAIHVAMSLVVLQVFLRGQKRWLWYAIAFHAASNLVGAYAAMKLGPYWGEAVIGVFAVAAIAIIVALRKRDVGSTPGSP